MIRAIGTFGSRQKLNCLVAVALLCSACGHNATPTPASSMPEGAWIPIGYLESVDDQDIHSELEKDGVVKVDELVNGKRTIYGSRGRVLEATQQTIEFARRHHGKFDLARGDGSRPPSDVH